jgi:hypothetical protein
LANHTYQWNACWILWVLLFSGHQTSQCFSTFYPQTLINVDLLLVLIYMYFGVLVSNMSQFHSIFIGFGFAV